MSNTTATWRDHIDDGIVAALRWGLPTAVTTILLMDLVRPDMVVGASHSPLVFAVVFVGFSFLAEALLGRKLPKLSVRHSMKLALRPGMSLPEKLAVPAQVPAWQGMQMQVILLSILALLVVAFR
jgi:hypothetical protein